MAPLTTQTNPTPMPVEGVIVIGCVHCFPQGYLRFLRYDRFERTTHASEHVVVVNPTDSPLCPYTPYNFICNNNGDQAATATLL